MSWLWLISVGVSDVQFPVWSKDEYGRWSRLHRFETGRAGVRAVHEGSLAFAARRADPLPDVGRLLNLLDEAGLTAAAGKHLQAILNRVIEG